MPRSVVAGFGNVLRGDDGFGVAVLHRLEEGGRLPDGTVLLEVGTAGLTLAQELLTPCDRLVVVDAMTRDGPPGRVYVLKVDTVEAAAEADLHLFVPGRALALAQAIGVLPREVFLVGCEPAEVDELSLGLSRAVSGSVEAAVGEVRHLLGQPYA